MRGGSWVAIKFGGLEESWRQLLFPQTILDDCLVSQFGMGQVSLQNRSYRLRTALCVLEFQLTTTGWTSIWPEVESTTADSSKRILNIFQNLRKEVIRKSEIVSSTVLTLRTFLDVELEPRTVFLLSSPRNINELMSVRRTPGFYIDVVHICVWMRANNNIKTTTQIRKVSLNMLLAAQITFPWNRAAKRGCAQQEEIKSDDKPSKSLKQSQLSSPL